MLAPTRRVLPDAQSAGARLAARREHEPAAFDPCAVLAALDGYSVSFVVVGAFARVIHSADELTEASSATHSMREDNLPAS